MTGALRCGTPWAVIGRFRPGRYPLWGWYYLRWWLVQHVQGLVPLAWLTGTPLMPLDCRLTGARVGANCYINSGFMVANDLLTMGDNTSINLDAHLLGYAVEDGMLIISPIHIGGDCFVGTHAVIAPGARLADGVQLGEHSMLSSGETIPPGEYWVGSPARPHAGEDPSPAQDIRCAAHATRFRRAACTLAHVLGMAMLPLVPYLAVLPARPSSPRSTDGSATSACSPLRWQRRSSSAVSAWRPRC